MKEERIKSTAAGKILAVLLGIAVLFTAAAFCIKPICNSVIRQAYIGDAVRLRTNDVVFENFKDMETEDLINIDEMVRTSPELEEIVGQYLDALVLHLNGKEEFTPPDTRRAFQNLNEDIISMLEEKTGGKIQGEKREMIMESLKDAEAQVTTILYELPMYIQGFGSWAETLLKLYGIMTAAWFLAILLLVTAGLGVGLYVAGKQKLKWLQITGIIGMIDGAVLAVLPFMVRQVQYEITNRLLGRSTEIEVVPFYIAGFGLMAAGGILLAVRFFRGRKQEV